MRSEINAPACYRKTSAHITTLNDCEPFRRVLDRFHEHDVTLFEVADLLRPGSTATLSAAAVWMLEDEVRAVAHSIDAE
jgi:hypothetical protein